MDADRPPLRKLKIPFDKGGADFGGAKVVTEEAVSSSVNLAIGEQARNLPGSVTLSEATAPVAGIEGTHTLLPLPVYYMTRFSSH